MKPRAKSSLFIFLLVISVFLIGALGRTVDWQYINEAATKLQGLTIGGTGSGDPLTTDGTQTVTNKTNNNCTYSGGTFTGGTFGTPAITTPTVNGGQVNASGGQLNLVQYLVSVIHRSQFTYNGDTTAYTIKASGGVYIVKDKIARWNSELTTNAISSPVADTFYYLYLDYSAITSETLITNAELIWSTTAPTKSEIYKGHYNGDDLCIFALQTDITPSNIREFLHDGGDFLFYCDVRYDFNLQDFDTWTEVTLSIPEFARRANCTFETVAVYGESINYKLRWRPKGVTANYIRNLSEVDYDHTAFISVFQVVDVITDSNQKIEISFNGVGDHEASVTTNGWYFPQGM